MGNLCIIECCINSAEDGSGEGDQSVVDRGGSRSDERDSHATEDSARPNKKRLKLGKNHSDKDPSDTKVPALNGSIKPEKVGLQSTGHKSPRKPTDGNREGNKNEITSTRTTTANSLSDEKRETLRRLLNVSSSKETPAVFGRKKIDSYKLSLTFPDDDDEEDEEESQEEKGPVLLTPVSPNDFTSPIKKKLSPIAKCNGAKSAPVVTSSNATLTVNTAAASNIISSKVAHMKIPPLHFRKINRVELGKNIMKGPMAGDERPSLPGLVDHTAKNRGNGLEKKPEPLTNGQLKMTSPLLPTPTR